MNKKFFIILISFLSAYTALAACDDTKPIVKQMDITAANIAHADSSYKKKNIYCAETECVVNEVADSIDVSEELEKMIQLQELYEHIVSTCSHDLKKQTI